MKKTHHPVTFTILLCMVSSMVYGQLSFVGAGVLMNNENAGNVPVVFKVLKFSPAEDAGIRSGEKIWAVDGKTTEGKAVKDVVAMIKGDAGTVRRLTVGDDKREVSLTIRLVKGKCTDGDCIDGEGRIEEPDGNIFRGNFTNGKFDGDGLYYWYEGETMTHRYEGAFVNGTMEGRGTLQNWKQKYTVKGTFKAGKLEGPAEITFMESPAVYSGTFRDDKLTGTGTLKTGSGGSQTLTPASMQEVLDLVYGKPVAVNAQTPAAKKERNLTINEDGGGSSRADLTSVSEAMKKVEMGFHRSLDAYAAFRSSYRTGMDKGNSEEAAQYADRDFRRFMEPYGEALQAMEDLKARLAGVSDVSESQQEEFNKWQRAILVVWVAYEEGKDGDQFTASKFYWANLNYDKLKGALEEAAAHRHSF